VNARFHDVPLQRSAYETSTFHSDAILLVSTSIKLDTRPFGAEGGRRRRRRHFFRVCAWSKYVWWCVQLRPSSATPGHYIPRLTQPLTDAQECYCHRSEEDLAPRPFACDLIPFRSFEQERVKPMQYGSALYLPLIHCTKCEDVTWS